LVVRKIKNDKTPPLAPPLVVEGKIYYNHSMQVPYRKPGKYSQIKSDPLLTEGKILELTNKLDRLKNISRPRTAEEVRIFAELGDFSENVEYQLAKGKLRGINDNIIKIENQLKNAVIIPSQKNTNIVALGHTVTIQKYDSPSLAVAHSDMNSLAKENSTSFQILGSMETNPQKGIISHNSPIGAALMGHKIGDIIKIKINDKNIEYKIIKIKI